MAAALPTLPMIETVMVRLMRISVVGLGQYFEPVFRAIGLTETSFHVLCLLTASAKGQASPSELSDLVGTSRANMTRILDGLVQDSLVLRAGEVRDARRSVVQITACGREVASQALPALAEPLCAAFADLEACEMDQLEGLLRKLIRSFDKSALPLRASA